MEEAPVRTDRRLRRRLAEHTSDPRQSIRRRSWFGWQCAGLGRGTERRAERGARRDSAGPGVDTTGRDDVRRQLRLPGAVVEPGRRPFRRIRPAVARGRPTFFPALETTWAGAPRRFIDGGVWANNPAHIGLLEALATGHSDPGSVLLVSLGTGASPNEPSFRVDLSWLGVAKETMEVATTVQTGHLMCQRYLAAGNYHRLQVVDPNIAGAMDDPSKERLAALAAAASRMIAGQSGNLDHIVGQLSAGRSR
jgi:hypothetical protein